jgi:hypothetical protein
VFAAQVKRGSQREELKVAGARRQVTAVHDLEPACFLNEYQPMQPGGCIAVGYEAQLNVPWMFPEGCLTWCFATQ